MAHKYKFFYWTTFCQKKIEDIYYTLFNELCPPLVLDTFLYNKLNLSPAAWDMEEEVEED